MAFRSRWWPRWWWRRELCSSSGRAIWGPSPSLWRREPISAPRSLKGRRTSVQGSCWLFGASLLIEAGVLVAAGPQGAPAAARRGRPASGAGRGRRDGRDLRRAGPRDAAGERRGARAGQGRRAGDPVVAGLGGGRRQVAGHRRRAVGRRRGAADRRDAALRAPLVDPGHGRGGRLRRGDHLRLADRARPAVQQVHGALAGPHALGRPRAGPAGEGRRGQGLRGRRLAPHDAPPTPT